jgi:hypothetical protein
MPPAVDIALHRGRGLARRCGVQLPDDLKTINRQLEVLLSGEGVQTAKMLMAPAPEGGE